jgi:hypothetical protein
MMNLRATHAGPLLALLLTWGVAGCDTSGSTPPRDENGQIRRPDRPGPSQAELRAKFLEQEKKNRQGARR